MLDLIQNQVYTYTMLGICCLLFIITGIQFWITDYLKAVLMIPEHKVFITFSIVCITAPTAGVLLGGYVIERMGGYTNKNAIEACMKIAGLAAICGLPLPLIDYFPIFIILMWLLLFFGGSIVPGLTGIMLSSIPNRIKETANSLTHLCYNLIGYLPSPLLYGLVCSYTGGKESRWGLAFLMLWGVFGVGFLYLSREAKKKADELLEKTGKEDVMDDERSDEVVVPFENRGAPMLGLHRKESSSTELNMESLTALYGRISITK